MDVLMDSIMDSTADLPSLEATQIDTISIKTHSRYNSFYDTFIKWQESNGISLFDEDVLLAYFNESSEKHVSSTLWSRYSMLKSTLLRNNNVDISNYSRLLAFLKEKQIGFERKKSKVLSAEEIYRFLVEAPDEHYLMMKVHTITKHLFICLHFSNHFLHYFRRYWCSELLADAKERN